MQLLYLVYTWCLKLHHLHLHILQQIHFNAWDSKKFQKLYKKRNNKEVQKC